MPIILQADFNTIPVPTNFVAVAPVQNQQITRSATKPLTTPLSHEEDEACQSMLLINYII
ncbi:hypothetical protein THRCLA_22052 [Thraustotheca clavata]|uniref:Uncharacterized protein n=1 Tax=Thraustotheca clavata TaxID=74557 RepID=A0A1V9ZD35_9STRA|nr:hypothetical protein THRCLA_22052 [Thraustotheca clavata]